MIKAKTILTLGMAVLAGAVHSQDLPLGAGTGVREEATTKDGNSIEGRRELSQSRGRTGGEEVNLFDMLSASFSLPAYLEKPVNAFRNSGNGQTFLTGLLLYCSPLYLDAIGKEGEERVAWSRKQTSNKPHEKWVWEPLGQMTDRDRAFACAWIIYKDRLGVGWMGWPQDANPLSDMKSARKFQSRVFYQVKPVSALFKNAAERLAAQPPAGSMDELRDRATEALKDAANEDEIHKMFVDAPMQMVKEQADVRAFQTDLSGKSQDPVHFLVQTQNGDLYDIGLNQKGARIVKNGTPFHGDGYIDSVQYTARIVQDGAAVMRRGATVNSSDSTESRSDTSSKAGTP